MAEKSQTAYRKRNVIFAGIRWKYRKEDQFGTLSDSDKLNKEIIKSYIRV